MGTKRAFLITLNLDKDGDASTPHEISVLIRAALKTLYLDSEPTVYVATSETQPDDTRRRTFLAYVALSDSPGMKFGPDSAKIVIRNTLASALSGRDGLVSLASKPFQPDEES
jgi:hypothetical protein